MFLVKIFVLLTFGTLLVNGFIESLYCGEENCYDLLGITIDATQRDVTKAFRKLGRKWHPDMHKTKKDKEAAGDMFSKISNAYDILKDEDSRKDYDYMLDNPEEYYQHYYRYYRHRVAPKVDVRIVIVVSISLISIIQYWSAYNNYHEAVKYLTQNPKYRLQATNIAKQKGLLNDKRKKDRTKTKEEIREEEEEILRNIIMEKMDIRGGYQKPQITCILWIQLFCCPVYLAQYGWWWARWVWKFWVRRDEYGDEEKLHIIRKYLGLSQGKFDALEEHEREEFLELELWIKDKFVVYKQEKEDEQKVKMAESGRYKMYRRYMKKGGPGQMSFGPE